MCVYAHFTHRFWFKYYAHPLLNLKRNGILFQKQRQIGLASNILLQSICIICMNLLQIQTHIIYIYIIQYIFFCQCINVLHFIFNKMYYSASKQYSYFMTCKVSTVASNSI